MSKTSKRVLAERVKGNERLRRQQSKFEAIRRQEDRAERARKDEELNNVRLQLRDQAATFATKDALAAIEQHFDTKLIAAIDRLNTTGTEGFRERTAAEEARDQATKELLAVTRQSQESYATNRRWIIGLAVSVLLSLIASGITLFFHLFPVVDVH